LGQKTNPIGHFAEKLQEDLKIRKYVRSRLENAAVSKIAIERTAKKIILTVHTARPGIVIGKRGSEVDKLREELKTISGKDVQINISEIKRPELDAYLVAQNISKQLEGKISFRRAMKKSITSTMRLGAQGVKIACSGRLGGAEMARREEYKQGRIPLHTLRADIDYATYTAHTTHGCIGVKVWICNGEVIGKR